MVLFSVTTIASILPVSMGGVGVRESLTVIILAHFGISAETAVAFALLGYARQFIVGLAGGGTYLLMKDQVDISFARKGQNDD
jgi:uncharacterized membrane protein YbhN (UPF0104 family)